MALLTVQKIVKAGLNPTYGAAAATGDQFPNNGQTFVHVKNGGTAAITVTVDSVRPCDQGFDHDYVISVPAGGERMIGAFEQSRFNNADQRVSISYSGVTSVTIAVLSL
jgi:hypothetical protein